MILEGWLTKQKGQKRDKWDRKFFLLHAGGLLKYYNPHSKGDLSIRMATKIREVDSATPSTELQHSFLQFRFKVSDGIQVDTVCFFWGFPISHLSDLVTACRR